jgi:hypothetical protein
MASAICDNYSGFARCVLNGQLGLTELNREAMASSFENAMATEALGIVASSGVGAFRIEVKADLLNQIYLTVQLNGEIQATPFVLPAFAAGLLRNLLYHHSHPDGNCARARNSSVVLRSIGGKSSGAGGFPGIGVGPYTLDEKPCCCGTGDQYSAVGRSAALSGTV